MRKNTQKAFDAFWNNRNYGELRDSISTQDKAIYSYHTKLLWVGEDGEFYLNDKHFSRTTTQQQNSIKALLKAKGAAYFNCV